MIILNKILITYETMLSNDKHPLLTFDILLFYEARHYQVVYNHIFLSRQHICHFNWWTTCLIFSKFDILMFENFCIFILIVSEFMRCCKQCRLSFCKVIFKLVRIAFCWAAKQPFFNIWYLFSFLKNFSLIIDTNWQKKEWMQQMLA